MRQQLEKLRSDLNEELFEIGALENPLERLNEATKAIDRTIQLMNQFIRGNSFPNEQDEIWFFKQAKPEILALRIEEGLKYNLELNKPIGTPEALLKYYEDELKARRSFFRMNAFHYQYYKSGLSDLDNLYFLRHAGPLAVPLAELPEIDTEFLTAMSYLFAKFIAYEHLQYYILEQIAPLKYPGIAVQQTNALQSVDLKWTGDAINIVELAYGLWLTGQLNNGNASLNQIVRWLETNLHVSIGIIQRRFNEIERRKRLSPTKYLDQMRDAVLQKIEQGNA